MANIDPLELERREDCRRAVLEFLATRQALAHHPQTICRRLNEGHQNDFTVDEVKGALCLAGAKFAVAKFGEMGGTRYWQATSAGVLQNERGGETA